MYLGTNYSEERAISIFSDELSSAKGGPSSYMIGPGNTERLTHQNHECDRENEAQSRQIEMQDKYTVLFRALGRNRVKKKRKTALSVPPGRKDWSTGSASVLTQKSLSFLQSPMTCSRKTHPFCSPCLAAARSLITSQMNLSTRLNFLATGVIKLDPMAHADQLVR